MSDDASLQQGPDGKPRTMLRTFSNSFKKGTANLRRGLTPRSRTSSQTDELAEAVPPPPAPAAASAPPKLLDTQGENQVHVKIAEVDGAPKVHLHSGGQASEKGTEGAQGKAPPAGAPKPATDVKPAADTKPAPAPPAAAPPPLPDSDQPAPPATSEIPTPDKAEHKVEPSASSAPAPDTPKQPNAPEFPHPAPAPPGPPAAKQAPAEAAGERVAAAARGEPITHEPSAPKPAAPAPVERSVERSVEQAPPASEGAGAAPTEPVEHGTTVKAASRELEFSAEEPKKEAGSKQVDFSKVAQAALAAAVLVAGAVAAKRHFDSAPQVDLEDDEPLTRKKGFWQRD